MKKYYLSCDIPFSFSHSAASQVLSLVICHPSKCQRTAACYTLLPLGLSLCFSSKTNNNETGPLRHFVSFLSFFHRSLHVFLCSAVQKIPLIDQSGTTAIPNFLLDSDFIPVPCPNICYKDFSVQKSVNFCF